MSHDSLDIDWGLDRLGLSGWLPPMGQLCFLHFYKITSLSVMPWLHWGGFVLNTDPYPQAIAWPWVPQT